MKTDQRRRAHPLLFASLALVLAAPLAGQGLPVLDLKEQLDFDRPEAWAMKFFASASLLTSLGDVERREPGSIALGFEAMSLPHLDRGQRTVGFNGQKEENLNRTPAWGRLRAFVGLPAGFTATIAWIPPLELEGVEANLVGLALERPIWQGQRWGLGARLFGQLGTAQGDFTCTAQDASAPVGSPENAFGCEGVSSDEVELRYVGLEAVASRRLGGPRDGRLHASVFVQRMDLDFQVDAQTFGVLDRTLLLADGTTWAVALGGGAKLFGRARASAEVFYTPLSVERAGESGSSNDPLLNVRVLLRVPVRGNG